MGHDASKEDLGEEHVLVGMSLELKEGDEALRWRSTHYLPPPLELEYGGEHGEPSNKGAPDLQLPVVLD